MVTAVCMAAGTPTDRETSRLLQGMGAALERAQQLLQRSTNPRGGRQTVEASQEAEKLLTAVGGMATLVEQSLESTGQAALQRLDSARAAATRSCAYLACANLAVEGGPAAGEGKGSLRCSGCKVAWYCSTVCSHADWRAGGHRRVCRVLAAARAAEQAA
jgi:hypothetical protein